MVIVRWARDDHRKARPAQARTDQSFRGVLPAAARSSLCPHDRWRRVCAATRTNALPPAQTEEAVHSLRASSPFAARLLFAPHWPRRAELRPTTPPRVPRRRYALWCTPELRDVYAHGTRFLNRVRWFDSGRGHRREGRRACGSRFSPTLLGAEISGTALCSRGVRAASRRRRSTIGSRSTAAGRRCSRQRRCPCGCCSRAPSSTPRPGCRCRR